VLCLRGLMFSYTERCEVGVLVRGVHTGTGSLKGILYDNVEVLIERRFFCLSFTNGKDNFPSCLSSS